jgi:hypothetical protein
MSDSITLDQIAQKVNANHERMQKGTRLLLDIALETGEALAEAGKVSTDTFPEGTFDAWLEANIAFSRKTAYRYISLFNHRNQIKGAENLQEAYKQIETIEAQKKQTETQKAYNRVAEYRETGVKPEGWRQHTDDKLAKEETEQEERIKRFNAEREAKREAEQREWKEREENIKRLEEKSAEYERQRKENPFDTETLIKAVNEQVQEAKKRQEFKEAIRLSADGMKDPFQDAIIDYLDGLENDSRRIEVCYNIIKICKRIANELQSKGVSA